MKKIYLLLICIISLIIACNNEYGSFMDTEDYEYSGTQFKKVTIENFNGDVEAVKSDYGDIHIYVTKRSWLYNFPDNVEIDIEKDGETLRVRTVYHDHTCHDQVNVNYKVYIPECAEVNIKNVSGDIYVGSGIYADNIATVSGDVKVKISQLKENIEISTTSGDITAEVKKDIYEKIRANTISGDIDFENISKYGSGTYSLELTAISGDIEIMEL